MPLHRTLIALTLAASSSLLWAQTAASTTPAAAAPGATASTYVAPPWIYKTKQLEKAQVDALLARPEKLVIIDLRRPDELVKYGSFPVYLNVQLKDLPNVLAFIPKDRTILTVSNRAHRGGAAGDLLTSKGFKVAGATGSEDYREAGGTIVKVEIPVRPVAAAPGAAVK
jgi:rhodanese-related sulfurtransferase